MINERTMLLNRPGKICYPRSLSEFELQAKLYTALNEFCDARGEVRAACGDGGRCRFDIVVFYPDQTPAMIIECKSPSPNKSLSLKPSCRQGRRYTRFGVPVLRCAGTDTFDQILSRVELEMTEWLTNNAVRSAA